MGSIAHSRCFRLYEPTIAEIKMYIYTYGTIVIYQAIMLVTFEWELKMSHRFDFFARLISNSFCENSNLPNIHYDMLAASSFVQLLYVVL